jgi:hypothetical protein
MLSISGFIPDSFVFINNYPNLIEFKIDDNSAFNEDNFYNLDNINLNNLRKLKIGHVITINDIFTEKLNQFIKKKMEVV